MLSFSDFFLGPETIIEFHDRFLDFFGDKRVSEYACGKLKKKEKKETVAKNGCYDIRVIIVSS